MIACMISTHLKLLLTYTVPIKHIATSEYCYTNSIIYDTCMCQGQFMPQL